MKNLNILLSINVRWWNAEAAYAINVARVFKNNGHHVWLIVNRESPVETKAIHYDINTITQVDLDTRSILKQVKNLKWLFKFVDSEKIDIINSFKSNGAALYSVIKRYRPHITYVKTRGDARPPKNNIFNRALYGGSGCHGIITVGESVKRWVEGLNLKHQKIKTIYYGDSPVSQNPNIVTYDSKEKVLLLIGRTQQVKGHLYILDAIARLKDKSIKLWFLVKDLEEYPQELAEIRHFIEFEQLEAQVVIMGFQKDLEKILRKAHLGVVPSVESEVNCRVVVELFSMGIPVLAFPTGTLPELIQHKKNGYLCKERSVEELVKGIKYLFSKHCDYSNLRNRALESYQTKYTLEKLFNETLNFYQDCNQKNSS